jgi:hypothetical protein
MSELGIFDTFGVPEFFVTEIGAIESAGGGNTRVIRCIKRRGVLVPVFTYVTPTLNLVIDAATVREQAQEIFNREQVETVAARH